MAVHDLSCELCVGTSDEVLWRDSLCRVVRVSDPDYAGFCRVIWNRHVREMTDLAGSERRHLMSVVFATEAALRRLCRPHKVNLASLGNVVPHLHWHVIARHAEDRHFPNPIWAAPNRPASAPQPAPESLALQQAIVEALAEEHGGSS